MRWQQQQKKNSRYVRTRYRSAWLSPSLPTIKNKKATPACHQKRRRGLSSTVLTGHTPSSRHQTLLLQDVLLLYSCPNTLKYTANPYKLFLFIYISHRMGKNKALSSHTSTYQTHVCQLLVTTNLPIETPYNKAIQDTPPGVHFRANSLKTRGV